MDVNWLANGLPFPVMMAALFCIVMARANGTYWLGRLAVSGAQRSERIRAFTETERYRLATRRLSDWGAPVVSLSFLTIGVQTAVNLSAGAIRMPLRRYLPAVTIGSVMWAAIYATIGVVAVEGLALMWARSPALTAGLAAVVLGLVGLTIWRQARLPKGVGGETSSAQLPSPERADSVST